jgi:hypothetical protein
MGPILITDASVLINLVASGIPAEILGGCGWEFHVCPDVLAEVTLLRDRETGEEHPIDLHPLFTNGLLTLVQPESDEEFVLLIDYSALLGHGKGEAMCFALAEARSLPVAIDDARAARRASRRNPGVMTLDTLQILKTWQERTGNSDGSVGALLKAIYRYARYQPATNHPEFEWWNRCYGIGS